MHSPVFRLHTNSVLRKIRFTKKIFSIFINFNKENNHKANSTQIDSIKSRAKADITRLSFGDNCRHYPLVGGTCELRHALGLWDSQLSSGHLCVINNRDMEPIPN